MAKKAQKRSAPKKASTKATKPARRPAGTTSKRATAPAKPQSASHGADLGERAQRLHEEILRSKLTHPDPWTYAPKARGWGDRAQVLIELIVVQGHSPAALRTLETLHAEVEGDRDFQAARRLF